MSQVDLGEAARAALARATTWAEPPATLEHEVVRAVAAELERTHHARGGRWMALPGVAAALIFVVGLAAATVFTGSGAAAARELDLEPTSRALGASAHASISETGGGAYIRLAPVGLPPAPADSYYEGWVNEPGGGSVSIGTFHLRGGDDPIALWAGVDLDEYRIIAITLEPDDGDPRSSRVVMLRGTIPPTAS